MPWFDLPLNQLHEYRTDTAEPPDLDLWWRRRLDEARTAARPPTLTRYEAGTYAPVEVFDTEFSGAGGDRIRAWYLRPPGVGGQTRWWSRSSATEAAGGCPPSTPCYPLLATPCS